MNNEFIYFEPHLDDKNLLITIFEREKLILGKGEIEYTSYCLDEYGEPSIDKSEIIGINKNCTLSEYEQTFKNHHQGLWLNKIPNGLYQLLTKQWKKSNTSK